MCEILLFGLKKSFKRKSIYLQTYRKTRENSFNKLMELEEKTQTVRSHQEERTDSRADADRSAAQQLTKETAIKRMKLEFELRTEQCKALDFDLRKY